MRKGKHTDQSYELSGILTGRTVLSAGETLPAGRPLTRYYFRYKQQGSSPEATRALGDHWGGMDPYTNHYPAITSMGDPLINYTGVTVISNTASGRNTGYIARGRESGGIM